ncbi:MAG TPA: MBL fold metallo-hydrolase [Phenylobacterium sp.]|nr:MBL fold metallo-hydrolase [Phenylobacterium sp.]
MIAKLSGLAVALALAAAGSARAAEVCWVEFSHADAPGAFGAAGATSPVWKNTASGLLVRHPKGHVLIDAGWSRAMTRQLGELSPQKRPMAERLVAGAGDKTPAPEALAKTGETPAQLRYILPTHAHYDHMAGAEDLPGAPILLAPAEIDYLKTELAAPDIVAASDIRALQPRFRPIAFKARPHLGFARSFDLYGDGAIVAVPLPGHTPGSVGVFVKAGGKTAFLIGDAAFVGEAVEKGLPKNPALRPVVDNDGPAADAQAKALAAFHVAHPEIAIVPAHDRTAWEALFGAEPRCRP